MPSFDKIKIDLQKTRQQREELQNSIFRIKEELKKISLQKVDLLPIDVTHKVLQKREQKLKASLLKEEENFKKFLKKEGASKKAFQSFADPRQNIKLFSDTYPILLFPVRLETRFKQLSLPSGIQHQLWVRIFPDDCSIDTFEGTLTESEVKNARNYWINVWQAGQAIDEALQPFINNLKNGAWRGLVGAGKAGRAYWTIRNYLPLNPEKLPHRLHANEVILVIPTEALPAEEEQKALAVYWQAIWKANGKAEESQVALADLQTVLGKHKAQSLIQTYVPANLQNTSPAAPAEEPQVAFLQFPKGQDTTTKRQAWSQAARVTTFPERFVLMGFKNKVEVFPSQLGAPIPDPLIIGPDPR